MNRILIIQTAFLGDVILATPLISELKRIYPEAFIDVLVKKGNESLLFNHPAVSTILTFDKRNPKIISLWKSIRNMRKNRYDLVVNVNRFASSGILTLFSGAAKKYGFQKNPFSFTFNKKFPHQIGDGTYEVSRNLNLIAEFGALKTVRPQLFPTEKDHQLVSKFISDIFFCFAPASVWFTKQLPKEKWAALIKKKAQTAQVFLIGGIDDFELCKDIISLSGVSNAINLAGKLTILESAALMQRALRNYVNDSGPLHVASAMNAPVTAFFCSTIPAFGFGPLSDDSVVVETDLSLDCRPCGLHGHSACPKIHFNCGNSIDVNGL